MVVEPLVVAISSLVLEGTLHDVTSGLRRLEASGALDNPALYPKPRADHYARRLLWSDPAKRFSVIGFTWAPGQTTPLHDHAGFWGAEIVASGTMEETTYELKECAGDERFRFTRGRTHTSHHGAIGVIEQPREYHVFGNPGNEVARTLHVYGGDLVRCRFFTHDAGGWWDGTHVDLEYDD